MVALVKILRISAKDIYPDFFLIECIECSLLLDILSDIRVKDAVDLYSDYDLFIVIEN